MKQQRRRMFCFWCVFVALILGSMTLSTREASAFNEQASSDEILYSVKPDGTLWWQTDTITATKPIENTVFTEHVEHKLSAPLQVGVGWDTALDTLPGGGSTFYIEQKNGVLSWYRHDGYLDGAATWQGPLQVGEGWTAFTKVIAMGDGVLYGIRPNGTLCWNKHNNYKDGQKGYGGWVQPSIDVMTGLNRYKTVFGGGEGVFYAVTKEGKLLWFRHDYLKPVAVPTDAGSGMIGLAKSAVWRKTWQGPKEIGNAGWDGFTKLFCAGNGHIYGVLPSGELRGYDHTGWKTGDNAWGNTVKLSDDWKDFLFAFAAMPGNAPGN